MGVLGELAQIRDIKDFRLREVMQRLGLDSRQPALFYRALIREAREALAMIGSLERKVRGLEGELRQSDSHLSKLEGKVVALREKLSTEAARADSAELWQAHGLRAERLLQERETALELHHASITRLEKENASLRTQAKDLLFRLEVAELALGQLCSGEKVIDIVSQKDGPTSYCVRKGLVYIWITRKTDGTFSIRLDSSPCYVLVGESYSDLLGRLLSEAHNAFTWID